MAACRWYCLNRNGTLHSLSREPSILPDGRIRRIWRVYPLDRLHLWLLAVEAKALGANAKTVDDFVARWSLTDDDAFNFAERLSVGGTPLTKFFKDGSNWCAVFNDYVDLASSVAGFGPRVVDAYADLLVNCNAQSALTGTKMVFTSTMDLAAYVSRWRKNEAVEA